MHSDAKPCQTKVVEGEREAGEVWSDPATVEVTTSAAVNLRLVNTGEMFTI